MPKRGTSEVFSGAAIRRFVAELVGTLFLVLIGCMGCLPGWASGAPPSIQYSTSFGMVVMFVVQIVGHISGGHVNPAVTLAAAICGLISIPLSILYVIAQLIGATTGYGLLLLLTPNHAFDNSTAFCVTIPADTVSSGQAVLIEAIITSVLILVCCAVWDPCNSKNTDSVPIKFGFTIAAISMSAGAFTGASMNPARSLGPALWTSRWDRHWVYWVGPLLGSAVSALLYHNFFKQEPAPIQREEVPLNEIRGKQKNESA
ncbi:aquaporin-like [Arctopsyche grandis]|uniref:aquaporin-like n=1 Tax=Arctopsyche grandis TaxID=121162 RepID=UPI00406D7D44